MTLLIAIHRTSNSTSTMNAYEQFTLFCYNANAKKIEIESDENKCTTLNNV